MWTKQRTQRLKQELSSGACAVIDALATRPGYRFSVTELVRELSLKNDHALRALLGKTTEAAKRIGVSQDKPHSWFVLWETQPEWRYWLDEERAEWWSTAKFEQLLADAEGKEDGGAARFTDEVRSARKQKRPVRPPEGNKNPSTRSGSSTFYNRDPAIGAWVLNQAKGKCESCGSEAPFLTSEGEPFLEVHHVHQLSDGGPDTIENAVAVCPNCHRALHYASDRQPRALRLYERIGRLVKGQPPN